MLIAIANVNEDWAIGKDGTLLCPFKEDSKFFRETTKGSTIICGRKTFEDFPGGKPLKGRRNIVLTRDISSINLDKLYESSSGYVCRLDNDTALNELTLRISNLNPLHPETATIVANSILNVLEYLKMLRIDAYVCGGQDIYQAFLPYCTSALITFNNFKAENPTAFFPNLDMNNSWKKGKVIAEGISEDERFKDTELKYTIVEYMNECVSKY